MLGDQHRRGSRSEEVTQATARHAVAREDLRLKLDEIIQIRRSAAADRGDRTIARRPWHGRDFNE
jgi:hypothetical protein